MKPNHEQNRKAPPAIVKNRNQPATWLVLLSPLRRYVNMRALALVMFVGFAVLNTTRGNDAKTTEPAAEVNKTEVVTKSSDESSPVAPLILWQFTRWIVQAFTAAVNDPSLVEYAKQQGTETLDLQTTPCRGAQTKTSTY